MKDKNGNNLKIGDKVRLDRKYIDRLIRERWEILDCIDYTIESFSSWAYGHFFIRSKGNFILIPCSVVLKVFDGEEQQLAKLIYDIDDCD